ncbi:MAG: MotA/TolQ/ExbB proton channel family protein [Phycisphaerales bacterium JB059]
MDLILTLAAPPTIEDAPTISIWEFVLKGGVMMIPIGICSLVALTVIVERSLVLSRGGVVPPGFVRGLRKILDEGGLEHKARAVKYCEDNDSPIARVLGAGVRRLGRPLELVEKDLADTGQYEVLKLRKRLRVLSVCASVAPLMGLTGTIFGMIRAFQTVAMSGESLGKAELLAEGIYEAMVTTAAGLLVAIPAMICYHWLGSRVERLATDIDRAAVDFVATYAEPVAPEHAHATPFPSPSPSSNGGRAPVQAAKV